MSDFKTEPLDPQVVFTGEVDRDGLQSVANLMLSELPADADEEAELPELPGLVLPRIYTRTTPVELRIRPPITHDGEVIWQEERKPTLGAEVREQHEGGGLFIIRSLVAVSRELHEEASWTGGTLFDSRWREFRQGRMLDKPSRHQAATQKIWLSAIGDITLTGSLVTTRGARFIASPKSNRSTGHEFKAWSSNISYAR